MVIPLATLKLVGLAAVLWLALSVISIVALSSFGFERHFTVLRPVWPSLCVLAIT